MGVLLGEQVRETGAQRGQERPQHAGSIEMNGEEGGARDRHGGIMPDAPHPPRDGV
ncbi:hypothetical protein GCM10009772_13670 [Pseudonocardia alni subsp. carboxydivorans]